MKVTWCFSINTFKYSLEAVTYAGSPYLAKIIPDSFEGITMRVDLESKLYAPNETSFDISNADGTLSESDFQDECCRIYLLLDGVLLRSWSFVIETATEAYGAIHCVCVDPVKYKLEGDFPNTPALSANFPSDQVTEDKDYKVPITLGTAYIPCMPFLVSGINYYCLGTTIAGYTIHEVRSPRSWDFVSIWDNSYTYTQSSKTGETIAVRATQLTIADADGDGTVDSNGVWSKNGTMLAPLINFTGPYPGVTHPGEWLFYLLQLFGVSSTWLDEASFDAVDSVLSAVEWGGGWWKAESKESILSNILSCCDCYLSTEDYIKLNLFSKTSVETFTRANVNNLSFSPTRSTKSSVDGGKIRFVWNGEPQDELTGEATVPLYGAQSSISNPSDEVLEYRFGYDNAEAQKFGILYHQKKFDKKYTVSFSTVLSEMTTRATIIPGKVVTIYDTTENGLDIYGTSKDVVITSLHIRKDLATDINGVVYNHLEEYADLSPATIVPDTTLDDDFNFLSLAKIVVVTGETVFHYASGAVVPDDTSVVLTAELFGGLTTYDWEYWNGSAWADLLGTQTAKTYTLAYNNAAWGTANTLRVRCLSGTVWDEITLVKLYDGAAGVTLKLSASSQVFQVAKDGTASPTSITFTAIGDESLSGDPTFSVVSGTATLTGTGTTRYLAYTGLSTDAATIRITWDGLTDEVTVVKLREGSDAYTALLTNEAAVLAATKDGTVSDFSPASGEMKVWKGAAELTAGVTYSKISNTSGLTIAINSATGVYTVTGMTVDTAIAVFQAAVTGGPTIQKTYSISKGKAGLDGLSVAELYIYKRSATELTVAPTAASSYNFSTQILTPPSGWSISVPDDSSHPVYICVGIASITGTSGTDSAITWSAPVKGLADGSAVDIVFKRNLTQPATPSASSGVPSGWYSDVNSVPASEYLLWSSVGTRANASENWTWQTPVKAEGFRGVTNLGVPEMNREISVSVAANVWASVYFNDGLSLKLSNIGWAVGGILSCSVLTKASSAGILSGCAAIFYLSDGVSLAGGNGLGTWVSSTTNNTTGYVRTFRSVIPPDDAVYVRLRAQVYGSPSPSVAYTIYGRDGMVYLGPGEQPYVPCVRDSKSIEYIFNHSATSTAPSLNTTAVQTDGYVPSGWSDDPSDSGAVLSSTYPYQWVSSRTKGEDGIWGEFAAPSLWAKYSSDAITPVLSNQAHSVPCDVSGTPTSYSGSGSTLQIYDGTTLLQFNTSLVAGRFTVGTPTVSPSGSITVGARSGSGTTTCTIANHSAMTSDVVVVSYPITVRKYDGSTVSLTVQQTITKSKTGATGPAGDTGPEGPAGPAGDTGPGVVYRGPFTAGSVLYFNGPYRRDIVTYAGNYYIFKANAPSGAYQSSWVSANWEAFGAQFSSVATDILLADDVIIKKSMTFEGTAGGQGKIYVTGPAGLTINSAGGLVVNSGAGITVNAGGDIRLVSDAFTNSEVIFDTAWSTYRLTGGIVDDRLSLYPSSNSGSIFSIGKNHLGDVAAFNLVHIYARTNVVIGNLATAVVFSGSTVYPAATGGSLGISTNLWSEVWATDGSINTSDKTKKDSIEDSDLGLDFIKALSPKKWVWNWGNRPHYGLIAQDVGDLLAQRGHDFAGYIKATHKKVMDEKSHKEKWVEEKAVKAGQEIIDSKDEFFIRYHEFIGPLIKAVQELSVKVEALENPATGGKA